MYGNFRFPHFPFIWSWMEMLHDNRRWTGDHGLDSRLAEDPEIQF